MNRELSMEVGKKKQRCYKERNENKSFSRKRKRRREKRDENGGEEGGGWLARREIWIAITRINFFFLSSARLLVHEKKKKEKKRKQRWKIKHGRMCDVMATVQNHHPHCRLLLPVPTNIADFRLLGPFSWRTSKIYLTLVNDVESIILWLIFFSSFVRLEYSLQRGLSNSTQRNFKLMKDDYIRCNCSSFL